MTRIIIHPGAIQYLPKYLAELPTPPVVLLCTDTTVGGLYAASTDGALRSAGHHVVRYTVPDGEASKCMQVLDQVHHAMAAARLGRDGLVLALGGGVVSDLAGFAAATWMRGVRWAICPTTLEACVDASIGGKTGINHAAGKNLVGAFHHPVCVIMDPQCLRTLPSRDVSAGLAESVKHALIADTEFLAWHEAHVDRILALEESVTVELLARNARIKATVVESDEREQEGRREVLNFGHTIGHAIEHVSSFQLRHGEAVALGMVAAARISHQLGLLSSTAVDRIVALLAALRLPTRLEAPLDIARIVDSTHSDKKGREGKRRWVLLEGIGRCTIRNDVPDELVMQAVDSLIEV